MTPFLYQVAALFYEKKKNRLFEDTFVFPNRRAGAFFQKYLAEIAGEPLFSPHVITISEFFTSLSEYRLADRIEMLVLLYNCYREVSRSDESFDDFLYWGEMLLNDFDETDKYLVNARQLYRNVQNYRSLDDDLTHLTEQQIAAIRRFWSRFMPVEGNETKERFHQTWKILYELYSAFRGVLHDKGIAYEGMMFREVADRFKESNPELPRSGAIIFVGLHALTPAESLLMEQLKKRGVADFYWDYDSPFVQDEANRASYLVKENQYLFPSRYPLPLSTVGQTIPQVELIGVPSAVGQAKYMNRILSDLFESGAISDSNEAINTAIVLPDENLLIPVLYSIPSAFEKVNVTMGYGLSNASVSSLVEHLALLQLNLRSHHNETAFFHRYVKAVLSHPLVASAAKEEVEQLQSHILRNNRIVVPLSEIPSHRLLELIFRPITVWQEIPGYLQAIFEYLYRHLTAKKQSANSNEEAGVGTLAEKVERDQTVTCFNG